MRSFAVWLFCVNRRVMLLLADLDPQYNLKETNQKGLKTTNMRIKEDEALETIQRGWQDHAVQKMNLGAGLDLMLIPQDPEE